MPPKKKADDDKERLRKHKEAELTRIAAQMKAKQDAREDKQKEMAAAVEKDRDDQSEARERWQQQARITDQEIDRIVASVMSQRSGGKPKANAGDGCPGGSRSPISYHSQAIPLMKYGDCLDASFSTDFKFRIKAPPGEDILVHARPVLRGG